MEKIRTILNSKGLRVTPQRIAVLKTLLGTRSHPTAEEIAQDVRDKNPNIAIGTVYNILDTFLEKGMVKLVKTDRDSMRYDAVLDSHHHIYDTSNNSITDYYDDELNRLLGDYFREKGIPGFEISELKLQILGKYDTGKSIQ